MRGTWVPASEHPPDASVSREAGTITLLTIEGIEAYTVQRPAQGPKGESLSLRGRMRAWGLTREHPRSDPGSPVF